MFIMMRTIISKMQNCKSILGIVVIVAIYVATGYYFISHYLISDMIVLAGLMLSPYVLITNPGKKGSTKYLWFALLFVVLTWMTGVLTFFFIAIGLAILFSIESMAGQLNHLPLFLIGLISPAFKYISNALGFPVRLKLSELSGKAFQFLGYEVEVSGNVIVMNGDEFSVDPACVGLKMMTVSLLIGLLLLAYFQRKTGKQLSFLKTGLCLLSIVLLNIIGNFLRILILVMFKILPGNPMHDVIGVVCLMLYVILPAYFIIRWTYNIQNSSGKQIIRRCFNYKTVIITNVLLLLAVALVGLTKIKQQPREVQLPDFRMNGYSKTIVNNEIIKFDKPGYLIYIKPISRFYGAEHNPMVCWAGSGYEFNRINKQVIAGREIYTGTLRKGSDIIYAAWWFDNGVYQTIDQLEWRKRVLRGESIYLVNVNAANQVNLKTEILDIIKNKNPYAKQIKN